MGGGGNKVPVEGIGCRQVSWMDECGGNESQVGGEGGYEVPVEGIEYEHSGGRWEDEVPVEGNVLTSGLNGRILNESVGRIYIDDGITVHTNQEC